MGKRGGSSWLTAVKRAFRSPTKETDKSCRRREEHDQEEDEEKVFLLHLYSRFSFLDLSVTLC